MRSPDPALTDSAGAVTSDRSILLTNGWLSPLATTEGLTPLSIEARDNPIEVVTLFGPVQATRTQVMHQLMTKQFDVVHFAGHCFYDIEHPDRSGWVFGETEVLTAHEMNRIDRVPPFVFSNACESGVTPDRATKELPQSFAEAFFGRGVTNFVCTAWPVSDDAATTFALTVYRSLLGMTNSNELEPETRPMWQAMQPRERRQPARPQRRARRDERLPGGW